MKGH
jgi:hypothetical protein